VLASQPVDATRFLKTQEFARRIKAALATLMPANSVVDAVVFSIPGAFVPGAGVKYVRHVAPELAQKFPQFEPPAAWLESDPTDPLSEALGLAVITENDSNLAALGEAHFGASQNTKSSIHVSLLNGAGSGIVIDGALYRGGSGVAGEIAHVTVDPDGRLCACGNRGCLITAAYATGPSLVRQVADAYEHPMTLNDVLHLADAGDVGVIRILNDYGRLVGEALAGFTALFDPEMIVVDAALREAGHAVRDGIEETLQRRLQPMISESVTVAVGQLKSDAQLLGAVSLSNDMALRELIGPYSRR
jgi:predicted NBD/HSP70 family sugar kinase